LALVGKYRDLSRKYWALAMRYRLLLFLRKYGALLLKSFLMKLRAVPWKI